MRSIGVCMAPKNAIEHHTSDFIADKIKACTGGLAISTCKLPLPCHNCVDTY